MWKHETQSSINNILFILFLLYIYTYIYLNIYIYIYIYILGILLEEVKKTSNNLLTADDGKSNWDHKTIFDNCKPFKCHEKYFYFTLKTLFVHKIFKFLPWLFDLVFFTIRVSDTSDTSATRTDTSATRVLHQQHGWRILILITTRMKTYFQNLKIHFLFLKIIHNPWFCKFSSKHHGLKLWRAINREFQHLNILFIPCSQKNHT